MECDNNAGGRQVVLPLSSSASVLERKQKPYTIYIIVEIFKPGYVRKTVIFSIIIIIIYILEYN